MILVSGPEYHSHFSILRRSSSSGSKHSHCRFNIITEGYAAKVQIAEDIMEEVERDLEIDCKDEFTGKWTLMYVRMRFVAIAQV